MLNFFQKQFILKIEAANCVLCLFLRILECEYFYYESALKLNIYSMRIKIESWIMKEESFK